MYQNVKLGLLAEVPPSPSFVRGILKMVGVLLGLSSIILVGYNVLSIMVFPLPVGTQNMVTPLPCPPF